MDQLHLQLVQLQRNLGFASLAGYSYKTSSILIYGMMFLQLLKIKCQPVANRGGPGGPKNALGLKLQSNSNFCLPVNCRECQLPISFGG